MLQAICPSCSGAGKFEEDCHSCDGRGRIEDLLLGDGTSEICTDCQGDGVDVITCSNCGGSGFVVDKELSQQRDVEIRRFKKLLCDSVLGTRDLGKEIRTQLEKLEKMGVSDGEINNIIHDRSTRSKM